MKTHVHPAKPKELEASRETFSQAMAGEVIECFEKIAASYPEQGPEFVWEMCDHIIRALTQRQERIDGVSSRPE